MTIAEFKAWLEGFEAAMGSTPTPDQWEAIKAKIAQLREPVSLPAYRPYKRDNWWEVPAVMWNDERTVPLRAH